jgi:GrpB-like predicted nucleotidyltransferase (UPF0157 family)
MSPEMRRVVVVDYDPEWPRVFEALRAGVWEAVRDSAVGIEHIGSTSVPGLAAKPIIDMAIIVASADQVPLVINRLAGIGYVHRGNLGIEDREAFHNPPGLPPHHLYLCPSGSLGLINPLNLRDYLRKHPQAAAAYGKLKQSLAAQFPEDIDSYVSGKTDFILEVLREAGFSTKQLETIARANRKPT